MELELDSFFLIDSTLACGMHGKEWTRVFREKKGLKFTLITTPLPGIRVERSGRATTVIPIGWVRSYIPLPGADLEVPKKKAATRKVVRKSKVA